MRLQMSIENQLRNGLDNIQLSTQSKEARFVDKAGKTLPPADVAARRSLEGVFVCFRSTTSNQERQFSATSIKTETLNPDEQKAMAGDKLAGRDFECAVLALQEPLEKVAN